MTSRQCALPGGPTWSQTEERVAFNHETTQCPSVSPTLAGEITVLVMYGLLNIIDINNQLKPPKSDVIGVKERETHAHSKTYSPEIAYGYGVPLVLAKQSVPSYATRTVIPIICLSRVSATSSGPVDPLPPNKTSSKCSHPKCPDMETVEASCHAGSEENLGPSNQWLMCSYWFLYYLVS